MQLWTKQMEDTKEMLESQANQLANEDIEGVRKLVIYEKNQQGK